MENAHNSSLGLLELCDQSDVFSGSAVKIVKDGLTLAVFNIDETFYVTNDACTHGPGSLSEGWLEGEVIECDFHQGAFNVRTGEVVTPPCMVPLRTYAVHPLAGKIFINLHQSAALQNHICTHAQPEPDRAGLPSSI
jgi:nitrite reductase/ring-hydroxylating ferredoxin subunit